MMRGIKTLAKLELCNLFGWNVFRHTKDTREKRKSIALAVVWAILIVMVVGYIGGLAWGLVWLGMADVVPAYLMVIASVMIFFFGIFKAGGVLYRKNGYDILCALPVSRWAIVLSRFARMYMEDLLLAMLILLPGLGVYGWMLRPGISVWVIWFGSILIVPMLPIAAAAVAGAAITALSSRMKHKSLVEAGLTVALVVLVLLGTSRISQLERNITPDALRELSDTVFALLEKLYPPGILLGRAVVNGDWALFWGCAAGFAAVLAAVWAVVSLGFHDVCRRLYATSARHDYRMERLKERTVLGALFEKEWKRYFSSGIYVSNTIIGPVLAAVLSAALLFVDLDTIQAAMGFPVDLRAGVPFLVAGIFSMMTTSSVSVSMEGQNFWIVKSLPLNTKDILNAKILLPLSLDAPFYLVSEICMILSLRPVGLDLLWTILIPALFILFSSVYGVTVNLRFPVLNWENETAVVKQSASAMLGMLGFLLAILCAVPVIALPQFAGWIHFSETIALAALTVWLYRNNNRFPLQDI